MSLFIDMGLITGMQPSFLVDGLGGGFGVAPVAEHDVGASDQQFILFPQAHLDTGEGLADAGGKVVFQGVDTDHRARLGQSISLQDLYPQTDEESGDGGRQGGAAAHGQADLSSQLLPHLSCHQPIEQRPEQLTRAPRSPALGALVTVPADLHGQLEQLALPRRLGCELILDPQMDALEDAGYRNEDGRLYCLEIGAQLLDGTGEGDGGTRHDRQVVAHGTFQHV